MKQQYNPKARPSSDHLQRAIIELSMMQFFPSDELTRAAIMNLLGQMVNTLEELTWLVQIHTVKIGKWRGPVEMRGVFCTRFIPADGHMVDCMDTPGFTPGEIEQREYDRHLLLKNNCRPEDVPVDIMRLGESKDLRRKLLQ